MEHKPKYEKHATHRGTERRPGSELLETQKEQSQPSKKSHPNKKPTWIKVNPVQSQPCSKSTWSDAQSQPCQLSWSKANPAQSQPSPKPTQPKANLAKSQVNQQKANLAQSQPIPNYVNPAQSQPNPSSKTTQLKANQANLVKCQPGKKATWPKPTHPKANQVASLRATVGSMYWKHRTLNSHSATMMILPKPMLPVPMPMPMYQMLM